MNNDKTEFDNNDFDADLNDDFYEDESGESSWDDEALDDDNFGDEALDELPDAAPQPAKKKSSLFNILIIAGGVAAGAFFILPQFMGGGDTPPPQQQQQQPAAPQQQAQTQAPATPQNATATSALPEEDSVVPSAPPSTAGFLSNPALLEQIEDIPDAPASGEKKTRQGYEIDLGAGDPLPTPGMEFEPPENDLGLGLPETFKDTTEGADDETEAEESESAESDDEVDQSSNEESALTEADSAAETDNALSSPAAPTEPLEELTVAQPAAPTSTQPATINVSDDTLKKIEGSLAVLLDRIDSLEQEITTLKDQPGTPVGGGVSNAALRDLQSGMKALERRLNSLEKVPSGQAPRNTVSAATKNTITPMPKTLAPAPATKPTTPPMTLAALENTTWVLRAAQPQEAYVSQIGKNDMVRVRVGETLPGLGQVKTIHIVNGLWVIEGTKGFIAQK